MSSSMNTILIIGSTTGIGAAFARRFHSMGKHVIVTGRRESKLNELKATCKGLETYTMDMTDFAAISQHVAFLTKQYPNVDTVWINGAIQYAPVFAEMETSSDERIRAEIDTNVTAPLILARYFIPFLLQRDQPTNFLITTSALAFIPVGAYPIYGPTKALIHHFLVGLRQQMAGTSVNIIEIVPPRVETDLDAAHKDKSPIPAMSVQEYMDETFKILDAGKAEDMKEVAVGMAAMAAKAWRESIGGILETRQIGG